MCLPLQAQDPVKAFPDNYKLVLDNSAVAVIHVHYGPHEKVGVHDHSNYPTIYVYLGDSGPVRFVHSEGAAFTVDRPPLKLGSFRVAPTTPERHTVENLGDIPSDFLRVELKQFPLTLTKPFRGEARVDLTRNSDTVEFTDGELEMERLVCVDATGCSLKAARGSSLLVAFTPFSVTKTGKVEAGDVRWLSPSDAAQITPQPGTVAHFLRIVIPETTPETAK